MLPNSVRTMRTTDGDVNGNDAERSAMKIMFVTRSISGGGAERQLLTLAGALAGRGVSVGIISFYPPPVGLHVPNGVNLIVADKRGRWNVIGFYLKLVGILRREKPDIIHPYLPVPNSLVALAAPFCGSARVVFGLRASTLELSHYDWLSALSYSLERLLSRRAALLIANAHSVRTDAIARGYPGNRIVVVHNGIDTDEFDIDLESGAAFRARFGIAPDRFVLGHIGRFDPMKDHTTFLRAFANVAGSIQSAQAIIVGGGSTDFETALRQQAKQFGIADRIVWTGPQVTMREVYNSLDVLCISSQFGEGFPNVLGEAMACSIPCITTDVGDAAIVVGGCGEIVPPRDPGRLAIAIRKIAAMPASERHALGTDARQRIIENFSIEHLVNKTRAILTPLVRTSR